MQKKVIITTDSAADFPQDIREKYGIQRIPLYVTLGERQCRDGVDVFPEDLYQAYAEQGVCPKTAAASVGDYVDFFRQYTEQGFAVVHISLGAAFSSCAQVAQMAAQAMPESEIHTVDSGMVSAALGMLCVQAATLRDEGLPARELAARLEERREKIVAYVYLDTLDMVARGGRVPALTAMAANLLHLHPSITIQKDGLRMGKKYRGKSAQAQRAWLEDALAALKGTIDPALVFFLHTTDIAPEQYEAMGETVREALLPERLAESAVGCTCLSHCGFNCLILAAMKKRLNFSTFLQ